MEGKTIQLYDGYLNKFIQISPEGLKELKSPREGEPLAIVSEELQNKPYSFASNKEFQKFYKKYSKTRSLSVFQFDTNYVVFLMDNKSVHNIYGQFGTEPFPYQVFFLSYLKNNGVKDPAVLIEATGTGNALRVTTVNFKTGVQAEVASYETPIMFQNNLRDKEDEIRKKGFQNVKFFALGKAVQALAPQAVVLSWDDLFVLDPSIYVFEEPVLKIRSQKAGDFRSGLGIFAISLLLAVFSIFVFNALKNKTAAYNFAGVKLVSSAKILSLKLKVETGKRFLYILNKEPRYSQVIGGLLRIFPAGAYVKKISVIKGELTIIGYTGKSYRGFVRVFNSFNKRLALTGYKIAPLASPKADFRFIIRGHYAS